MKFCKLLKYDIVNGILRKAYLYILVLTVCIIFFVDFYRRISTYDVDLIDKTEKITIVNFLFYFFEGKAPFNPEVENAFVYPVVWLLIFLSAAFVTLDYPLHNLMENGTQVMIRVKGRKSWWFSKCFWVFWGTLLCFAVMYLGILLLCLFFDIDISMQYASFINDNILNMQLNSINSSQIVMLVLILPVMTALAINFLQLCLGLFLDRMYCYLISAILLFSSTYFLCPLAIGNFAMIKRSIFCNEKGMTIEQGIMINSILISLSIIVGTIRIGNYDILKKSN